MAKHKHNDDCWEPDSGCDLGRNEKFAVRSSQPLTKRELSLLLYVESCAVDMRGNLDGRKINDEELAILKRWNAEDYIQFGRIAASDVAADRHFWVELSDQAWADAHSERKARSVRMREAVQYKRNPRFH